MDAATVQPDRQGGLRRAIQMATGKGMRALTCKPQMDLMYAVLWLQSNQD